jgi:hypothetical protein
MAKTRNSKHWKQVKRKIGHILFLGSICFGPCSTDPALNTSEKIRHIRCGYAVYFSPFSYWFCTEMWLLLHWTLQRQSAICCMDMLYISAIFYWLG